MSIKVNWDAAIVTKNQKMGVGNVIRDASNEEVLACLNSSTSGWAECTSFNSQPILAECHALYGEH